MDIHVPVKCIESTICKSFNCVVHRKYLDVDRKCDLAITVRNLTFNSIRNGSTLVLVGVILKDAFPRHFQTV